jgi:hypothetical protein
VRCGVRRGPGLQILLGGGPARLPLLVAVALGLGVLLFSAAWSAAGEGGPAPGTRPRLVTLKGIRYDLRAKRVTMDGRVALTSGAVELLACVRGTKDYESVLALDCQPYDLHLGLLAIGLEPGRPARDSSRGSLPAGRRWSCGWSGRTERAAPSGIGRKSWSST